MAKSSSRRGSNSSSSKKTTMDKIAKAAMDAFQKNQQAMAGAFGPNMFADMAKRNMAMFEEAAQSLTGKKGKASSDGSADELAKLKAELAALQAKVDKLGK
jgi:polyhydroxyalkanoate synthesis regulator protein